MDIERPDYMSEERFDALSADETLLVSDLTRLKKASIVQLQELVAIGVMPDPNVLQQELNELRVNCILEQLFPDTIERTKFELWYQEKQKTYFEDIITKARRAKLNMGGTGLIHPKGGG